MQEVMLFIQSGLRTAAEVAAGPVGASLIMPLTVSGSALLSGGIAAKIRERLVARRPAGGGVPPQAKAILKAAASKSDYDAAQKSADEGERKMAEALRRAGIPYLRDVALPNGARIGNLVLAGRNLVCLEIRTWHGKVHPGVEGSRWTVVDRAGGRRQHSSPIERSSRQAEALRTFLSGYSYLRGYAVIAGAAEFDRVPPQTIRLEDLVEVLEGVAREGAPDRKTLGLWKRLASQRADAKPVTKAAKPAPIASRPAPVRSRVPGRKTSERT